jgi:hypothetical protein
VHGISVEEAEVPLSVGGLCLLDHDPDIAPLHIHQLEEVMLVHIGFVKKLASCRSVDAKGPRIHIVGKQILLGRTDAGHHRQRRKIVPLGCMVAKIVRAMAVGLIPHLINAVKIQMCHVFHVNAPLRAVYHKNARF